MKRKETVVLRPYKPIMRLTDATSLTGSLEEEFAVGDGRQSDNDTTMVVASFGFEAGQGKSIARKAGVGGSSRRSDRSVFG